MERALLQSKSQAGITFFSKLRVSLIRVRELIAEKIHVKYQNVDDQDVTVSRVTTQTVTTQTVTTGTITTETVSTSLTTTLTLDTQAGADNTTFSTSTIALAWDPDGAARTGLILSAPTTNGQHFYIANIGSAAETITFAASGTSNVAAGTSAVVNPGFSGHFIAYNSLWYITN